MRTHGYASSDKALRPSEYGIWCDVKKRCQNPQYKQFADYGGRGIRVCARWASFAAFLADMGPRPTPKHSIDRIDVNGNYEPKNCRWATRAEQSRNTRRNRWVVVNGVEMTLQDAAALSGQDHVSVARKLDLGMPMDKVLRKLKAPRKSITDIERAAILMALHSGETQGSVAKRYGVAQSYISKLWRSHVVEISP